MSFDGHKIIAGFDNLCSGTDGNYVNPCSCRPALLVDSRLNERGHIHVGLAGRPRSTDLFGQHPYVDQLVRGLWTMYICRVRLGKCGSVSSTTESIYLVSTWSLKDGSALDYGCLKSNNLV